MMDNFLTQTVKKYEDVMEKADPRVADWPMMSSPFPSIVICVIYFIVIRMGPTIMTNRKPYELKRVMLGYNFCMIILSAYILEEFLASGWLTGYSLGCQPVDRSSSPKAMRMARTCWMFYMSKFVELFDTIFFVMRKKFNQVSFLHVFHHGIMPMSWWFGAKFVPGGFGTFHAMFNSFIHFVMYTYYFLAALGPAFHKYLWWKRYMTTMQIVPSTEENWLKIAKEFQLKWNYPLCLGALDGKHVSLRQPPNSGSEFYNYKQFFSVVMLALVDANYKFLYVDVGATGRCGDAGIFNNSSLKTALDCNTLNFPGPVQHEFKMLNYHIIGDEAFALRKDLMKPFPHRSTSKEEKIFNYRLSRARRVVENAFGILSNRFRVFLTTICLPEDKVKKIILAACCLHNFLLDSQTVPPGLVDQEDDHHNIIPGSWRSDSLCLSDISATKANNVCLGAKEQRESLKAYFNSVAGQVHWQDKMISVNSTY